MEERRVMCPFCGTVFEVWEEEQTPGFRTKEYLFCPKCKKQIESSMEVEYRL